MDKKSNLSDNKRGMVVGARRVGLSISKIAKFQEFSCIVIFKFHREWLEKKSSERHLCRRKSLVDESDQRKMARLVQRE